MIGVQDRTAKAATLDFAAYAVIFLYLLFVLFPIFWIALLSLKNEVQAFADPPIFIFQPTFDNYYKLFAEEHFGKYLLNSIIIAVSQMAAGAIILILPAILISVFISKFFVQGLTSGSTKG